MYAYHLYIFFFVGFYHFAHVANNIPAQAPHDVLKQKYVCPKTTYRS